jgi:hypothetical protein
LRRWVALAAAALIVVAGSFLAGPARGARFPGGGVLPFGEARFFGSPTDAALSSPMVGMAASPDGAGYWLVAADGGVFNYGTAGFFGSAGSIDLNAPIIGMASTPDGNGYWMVALDGGVFAFGDAGFFGSTGGIVLNHPIVGMASTPTGQGYWLVANDGGVFAFGDAGFFGSTGGVPLNNAIVGMAPTPTGNGYWLVASDGGVFNFGDAPFLGSAADIDGDPIVGLAPTPTGLGFWLAALDGSVTPFGDALNYGGNADIVPTPAIRQIAALPNGHGYWLLHRDAFPTTFGHPAPGRGFGSTVVSVATGEVGANLISGVYCNPYGPCEQWCSLFATWVWQQAGVAIPRYPFTGDVFTWAARHGRVLPPTSRPSPGQLVLYGTGPSNASTSVHIGVVTQIWPDGAISTVEGDAGPGPHGSTNVIIKGPFLPGESGRQNGQPIYAFVSP